MRVKYSKIGMVLFTTMGLLMVVVLICSSISILVLRNSYTTTRYKYSTQAYFLAEAGVEEALKELKNDFSYSPSGFPKTLGAGTYNISISRYSGDASRKLIISSGTVRNVSKTIRVQVHYTGPDAFNYPALGGGKLTVAGGSTISNSGPVDIHSNSPANSGAVQVGARATWFQPVNTGLVEGNASACGHVDIYNDGISTVTGTTTHYAPYVELPPFDDNFFQYYYNLAQADGKIYSGVQIFTSDPCAGTTNHVVYVDGQVRLTGTWEMTGCIVATGKIIVNKWASGHITQHIYGNLPAFMSKGSDVEIWDPTDIEGMVYANGFIEIDSIFGTYGPTVVYGALYGKSWVNIKNKTELHYVRPNPPGLPSDLIGVDILSWSDG